MSIILLLIFWIILFIYAINSIKYNEHELNKYGENELISSPYFFNNMTKNEAEIRIKVIKIGVYALMISLAIFFIIIFCDSFIAK